MASRRDAVVAPIIDELRLIDLADADAGEMRAGAHHEGRRYTDADLAGLALSGVSLSECELLGVDAGDTVLRGGRFSETRIVQLNAPVLKAARTDWRDVSIERSRIGAAEMYEAEVQSVVIRACKLTYVNLRSATLRDVEIAGCTIDELDLGHVRAERVRFTGSAVRTLHLDHASLRHVDLRGLELTGTISGVDSMRGTILTAAQAVQLSDAFTQHLGIRVLGD